MRPFRSFQLLLLPGLLIFGSGCGDSSSPLLPGGTQLEVRLTGLPPLDRGDGSYALWAVDDAGGRHALARFPAVPPGGFQVAAPASGAVAVEVTVQHPDSANAGPSAQLLLRGDLRGNRSELSPIGAVTRSDLPLRERPGQFTMYFTPSDNAENGFPSNEEAGVWLFNISPRDTEQSDGWVRLTPLRPAWVYEGWVVRDLGSPREIWLSYGKFRPDPTGALNTRDDTGWGPFSSVLDFRTAGEEEYPGDDWISNPLNFPFPEELSLPLNLREKDAEGRMRWSHVITIEPAWDEEEDEIGSERPFILRPYRDSFVDRVSGINRTYGLPREITFHPADLPAGVVEVVG